MQKEITIEELLKSGAHFGHQKKRWNPKMKRFIIFERNGIDIIDLAKTKKQIENASRIRHDFVVQALTPRKDAIEVISTLKSNGHKIGLVSNCSPEPPVVWKDTPFAPLFDVTVFSSTAGLTKPDPRIYYMAIEKLKVNPEDCLYIGDGDSNELTGALKVGLQPILIRDPNEKPSNVIRSDYEGDTWKGTVITSLKEVLNLVK